MSELRECPFCGGALRIAAKRWFRSHCPTCHMIGPMPNHPAMPTRESAIRASNTRPADAVREAAKAAVEEWIGGDPDEFLIAMGRLRAVVEEK